MMQTAAMQRNDADAERNATKCRKRPVTDPEKDRKHIAYAAMVKQGMSKSQAALSLGYSTGSIGALDKSAENKSGKLTLLTDSRIKRAHKVVDSILKGATFGSIKDIKDSTALRAAEVVLDRAEPKAGADAGNVSISFTQINVASLETQPAASAIDITPCVSD